MKDIAVVRCLALAVVLAGSARALAGEDLGAWQPLPKEFKPPATSETRVSLHQGHTWAYLAKAIPDSVVGPYDRQFCNCPGLPFWNA
jgi:hypothetical protein